MSVLSPATAAALDPELVPAALGVLSAVEAACGRSARDEITRDLQRLSARLAEPEVSVVFAGRFSSGKSTLLNALLLRNLLPTGSYPETGVPCRIVAGAPERAALRRTDGSISTVRCTAADIAHVVRLTGDDGAPRPELRTAVELTVTLATRVVPAGACWVDTPGVDDGTGLPPRWQELAAEADVLVSVTRSDAPLALSEMALLDEYQARHSGAGCLLVVNVVLRADSPGEFQQVVGGDFGAGLRRRVLDAVEQRGLDLGEPVLLAARAMGAAGSGFGGDPLRELLADREALRIPAAVSRLNRARGGVGELIERVQAWVADERAALDEAIAAEQCRRAEQDRHEAEFAAALGGELAAGIRACSAGLRSRAGELADGVAGAAPVNATDLGRSLMAAFEAELSLLRDRLQRTLADLCVRYWRVPPGHADVAQLDKLLQPKDPTQRLVDAATPRQVADPKRGRGAAIGAVAGGAIGSIALLPFVGAAVGSAVGALFGGSASTFAVDRAAVERAVRAAGLAAAERLERREPKLEALLLGGSPPEPLPVTTVDPARVTALEALLEQLLWPAWQLVTAELAQYTGDASGPLAAAG